MHIFYVIRCLKFIFKCSISLRNRFTPIKQAICLFISIYPRFQYFVCYRKVPTWPEDKKFNPLDPPAQRQNHRLLGSGVNEGRPRGEREREKPLRGGPPPRHDETRALQSPPGKALSPDSQSQVASFTNHSPANFKQVLKQ